MTLFILRLFRLKLIIVFLIPSSLSKLVGLETVTYIRNLLSLKSLNGGRFI